MSKVACVVLPTYNEAENLPILLPRIFEQDKQISSHDLHVLVVDDNSPDGTQEVVQREMGKFKNLHLLPGEKKGLGEAYKRGMAHAISELQADLIFEMDADLQHDPKLIPLFVRLANHGFSLVIGSRFAPGGATPNFSFRRRFMSLLGNWMIRFLGGLPGIHDCTSGYRCIRADLILKCDFNLLSTRGYSFQSSLLCELLRNGARVVEIPIIFPDRQYGESKLALKDQIEFLFNIAKIRFRQSNEFLKFCIVGSSGVFVNMGLFVYLTRTYALALEISSPIAIEVSILSNFVLNNLWTFGRRKPKNGVMVRLLQFHAVAGVAGLVNFVVLLTLAKAFGVWDVAANLIGIVLATVVNYALNSLWTWRDLRHEP